MSPLIVAPQERERKVMEQQQQQQQQIRRTQAIPILRKNGLLEEYDKRNNSV